MEGAKTILLIGGLGVTAYLLSGVGKAAATNYAIDISDIDLVSVQPWTIEMVRSVPNLKSKVTLGIANPSNFELKVTYINLEMYLGTIKFGNIADNQTHTLSANNPKFFLDVWGFSSIPRIMLNGLVDLLLKGVPPEDVKIKGYLRVNGNLIQIDSTIPFKIPQNFVGVLKKRLHDLFPSKW